MAKSPSSFYSNEALEILENKEVSPEQYIAWMYRCFCNRSYYSGIAFTLLIAGFFGFLIFNYLQEGETEKAWVGAGLGGFFTFIFWLTAYSLKKGHFPGDLYVSPGEYLKLGISNMSHEKYLRKINEDTWEAIRDFKFVLSKEKEVKAYPLLTKLKRKFKTNFFIFLVLASLCLVAILIRANTAYLSSETLDYPLRLISALSFTITGTALSGWIFVHYLLCFLRKEVSAYESHYTGPLAQFFSILFMLIALMIQFLAIMPIMLLMDI